LKAAGWKRLTVADAPFANGGFPTPSGKCEFYSEWAAKQGLDPLPTYVAPYEGPTSNPELANRYPLAFISPPNRHFLNSSFANLEFARKDAGEPTLEMHPDDAAPRGISDGALVRIANDRGEFSAVARLNGRARRGVVIAPSVWWRKLSPDGCNANEVTSQALADLRGAATFYDCLVEVIAA
jgi:anaerobic selenocysteine-containing dehydrogenase